VDEHTWLTSSGWGALWSHTWEVGSDRKRQLTAVAACRQIGHLLTDPRSVRMLEFTEAWAEIGDDLTDELWDEREDLYDAAKEAAAAPGLSAGAASAAWAAAKLGNDAHKVGRAVEGLADVYGYLAAVRAKVLSPGANLNAGERVWGHPAFVDGRDREGGAAIAAIIRDVFGNPFRPVAFDPGWRTSTAVALARGMYDARDFAAMPVLADALQDSGCEDPDILAHCRGEGPHVRGCWVVDLVLGKS
jgi:hypothetical protein